MVPTYQYNFLSMPNDPHVVFYVFKMHLRKLTVIALGAEDLTSQVKKVTFWLFTVYIRIFNPPVGIYLYIL